MPIKRLHYFDHQFLVQEDFADEQNYHLEMRRRLNRLLHTVGIAEGLEVVKRDNKSVTVRRGMAIDGLGQEMIVDADQVVALSQFSAGATVFITIAYQERESDPATATGVPGNTRITEEPLIQAVTTTPPNDSTVIPLARFPLDSSANVPGNINAPLGIEVRQLIGPRGERGLASLDGVSNPGGNVDLIPGTGIAIIPDQVNRHITIANQGLVSVSGVSNPGGNVNLVRPEGQAISIVPNDATNEIIISENHSTRTDNPHNVTPQQIGALLASDYDLGKRAQVTVGLNQATTPPGTSGPKTVNVLFQPKFVLVVGSCSATLSGTQYSGAVSAFADLRNGVPGIQRGVGFGVNRSSSSDWSCRAFTGTLAGTGASNVNGICFSQFNDNQPIPGPFEELSVTITDVSATTLTVTLKRTSLSSVPLSSFNISLNMLYMA